jgi:hypothetical protein
MYVQCSAPVGRHWSAPTTTLQKVLILTMKLWKMKKTTGSDFGHEIMNLVEKNVGWHSSNLGQNPMYVC